MRTAKKSDRGALNESADSHYDEQRIDERSQVIAVAIDARAQFYSDEQRFNYQPMAGREENLRFSPESWERIVKDYNLNDLAS